MEQSFLRLIFIEYRGGMRAIYRLAIRYPDVFFVPWVLSPPALMSYVAARLVSLCVPLALMGLEAKVEPQLRVLSSAGVGARFQAAAARVNLGYLMICGAISLIVICAMPYIANWINLRDARSVDVLLWLVVGQAAPVLFGATGLLMRVLERDVFSDILLGLTALMFWAGVLVIDASKGVDVAQAFAATQLTHAAICALLLTQSGIWPGLTALLHKQIKLF
jgi:hypothetical protein